MRRTVCFFIVVTLLLSVPAIAEDRALVIGIGPAYQRFGINPISGPERDVDLAVSLAKTMGFTTIKTIREDAATGQAILEGFRWVKAGVGPGERALIYYSGHGAQIPDPENKDACAQAIVSVDKKLIINHEIGRWLKGMERSKVIFLIDSCFSGTITKSFYRFSDTNIKFYKGAPACGVPVNAKAALTRSFSVVKDEDIQKNVVALTATATNEVAYGDLTGGGRGSLFTQAIFDTVRQNKDISFRQLRDASASSIRQTCDRTRPPQIPHTPQIGGDPALFDKHINFAGESRYDGAVEDSRNQTEYLDRIVANSEFMVGIKVEKTRYRLGEKMALSVASSESGYLNIMDVGPDGTVNLLYPNQYAPKNNLVVADKEIRIPDNIGGFKLEAQEPAGTSKIIVLVTREPLNLYSEGVGKMDGAFKEIATDAFSSFKGLTTKAGVRSFKPVQDRNTVRFGAAAIPLTVER